MANKLNIRKWFITTIWIGFGVGVIILLIAAMQKNNKTICKNIELKIVGNEAHKFLTEADILAIINANDILNNKGIKDIDIRNMEKNLARNIWIEKVELFFDKTATLHITINEREPVCRVFKQNAQSFYLDNKLFLLPLTTNYSANVPVFTGFSDHNNFDKKDSGVLACILKMARYVNGNEFWKAQIQQFTLKQNESFEIIPTIGNHTVQFGDTTDMEQKFKRLFTFYKTVSSKVGFDKYAVLNLQFKNQIVATNNRNAIGIDTAKANQAVLQLMRNSLDSVLKNTDTLLQPKKQDTVLKPDLPPVLKGKPVPDKITPPRTTPIRNKQPIVPNRPKALMPLKSKVPVGKKI